MYARINATCQSTTHALGIYENSYDIILLMIFPTT